MLQVAGAIETAAPRRVIVAESTRCVRQLLNSPPVKLSTTHMKYLTHLVLFLEGHNFREGNDLALHAVDALDQDQDLLPGPVRARLPSCNAVPQKRL